MAQGDVNITVVGNLTADPELRFTPSGDAVANFTIASTSRLFDKNTNEWKDGDTVFLRCQRLAAVRGERRRVPHQGDAGHRDRPAQGPPVRDPRGRQGHRVDLDVDDIGPVLRSATAKVNRISRDGGGGGFRGGNQGGGGGGGSAAHRPAGRAASSSPAPTPASRAGRGAAAVGPAAASPTTSRRSSSNRVRTGHQHDPG